MQFIGYKNCGTCKKARKYLSEKGIAFEYREITENPLSFEELTGIYEQSGFPLQKFLNTSGGVYREMKMKEQMKVFKTEEVLKLLSENPMLVKRPILISDHKILIGFKEEEWVELPK